MDIHCTVASPPELGRLLLEKLEALSGVFRDVVREEELVDLCLISCDSRRRPVSVNNSFNHAL